MILEYSQPEFRALAALTSADKERLLPTDVEAITGLLNRYEEELLASREAVATCMRANGFATGHGDSLEDLLTELTWQVKELRSALAKATPLVATDEERT